MATCEVCGNDAGVTLTVTRGQTSGTFDSFECAIHALAPVCAHCGCRVLGHGHEVGGSVYCCSHCARQAAAPASPAADAGEVPDKQVDRWKDDGGAVMI